MKFKKEVQLYLLQPLGLYQPTLRDCMKNLKLKLGAVGPDLGKSVGKRCFMMKDWNFLTMESNKGGELEINQIFAEGRDVPEVYCDYIGNVKSIVRRYIKSPEKKGVTKETVITEYAHKATALSEIEQIPSKNKPYKVKIYKDDKGHVLKESTYTSDYKGMRKKMIPPYQRKETPDFLLRTLSLW